MHGSMEHCYYIPEDLLMNILSRVRVRSLTRFLCVCKSWYSMIRSPIFIQKHLLLSQSTTINNKDNGLFFLNNDFGKKVEAYTLFSDDLVVDNKSANVDIPLFHVNRDKCLLVGSCHGIVCLTDPLSRHYRGVGITMLWNPATREFKTLPVPHITSPSSLKHAYIYCMGFGFDAKTNDYKVVQIASNCQDQMTSIPPPLAEVYTLSTNSWKAIDGLTPSLCFTRCSPEIATYLDGVFYWWAMHANGAVLLSFDMADEVFRKTPFPDFCDWTRYGTGLKLTGLRGSVALVVYEVMDRWKLFDIWLMDKHVKNSSSSSWVRHVSIMVHFVFKPLGFWRNGEEFLFNTGGGEKGILSYNLKSQIFRDLHVDYGLPYVILDSQKCVPYAESLVSLQTGT